MRSQEAGPAAESRRPLAHSAGGATGACRGTNVVGSAGPWSKNATNFLIASGTRPPAASHRFYGTSALVVLSCGFRHSLSFIAQEISSSGFVYAERPPDSTASSTAPSFGVPSSGMPWSLSISDYLFSSGPSTEPSGFKPLPGPRHADQQAGDFWDSDSDKKLLSRKDSMGDEDVDAEGRPPYLHVRFSLPSLGTTGEGMRSVLTDGYRQ